MAPLRIRTPAIRTPPPKQLYINVAGVWKVATPFIKVAGVWK